MPESIQAEPEFRTEYRQAEKGLVKNQQRYKDIVETAGDTFYTTDKRGFITYVNPSAETLTGYTAEELYGKHFKDLIPADWQDKIEAFYIEQYESRAEITRLKFPIQRQDGSTCWIEQTVRLFIRDGKVSGFMGYLRDINKQVEAEAALEESEARYRSLVESSPEAIVVHSQGKLRYINPAGIRLMGASNAERLVGREIMDFVHPDYRNQVLNRVRSSYEERQSASLVEEKFIRLDGQVIDVEVVSEPILYQGQPATQVVVRDISEQKRARLALQQYAHRRKILHELDQAILEAGSTKEVAKAVTERVRQLVPCERVSVGLFDMKTKQVITIAVDLSEDAEVILEDSFPLEPGFMEHFKDQQIRFVEDIAKLPKIIPLEHTLLKQGMHTYINIPLIVRGELVGTLNLGAMQPGSFTAEHIEIAKELAGPLAVAIQQARLYEEVNRHAAALETQVTALRENERYLELLNEITHAANGIMNFQELIQALADRVGELFEADGCYIALWNEEGQEVIPAAACGPLRGAYPLLPPENKETTLTRSVLEANQVLFIEDIQDSDYISPAVANRYPHQSMLGIPLIADNHRLGAAVVAFDHPDNSGVEMLSRGEQAGGQIALAIAKAQLLEAERGRRQEAETLRIVTNVLASTLDLNQVLEIILDQLAVVISYDSASVMLWEEEWVRAVAAQGFDDPHTVLGKKFPSNNPLFDEIRRTGKALWLSNPSEDPRFSGWGGTEKIRSWLALPMFARGKFIGYMTLDSYEPGVYGPPQADLVQPFANQAAQAIENARTFDWVQKQAVTDALTGLYNRRGLFELGQREVERAQRFERPLVAIMLDIDHFKQVNDKFGHIIGDQVLCEVGRRCARALRKVDLLGRYGGEEFAVLLPETDLAVGLQIAERLRKSLAESPVETDRGDLDITISLGVTALNPNFPDLAAFLDAADSAMYAAKQAGRNCVRDYCP